MRHRVKTKKLSRDKSAREALILSQTKLLLQKGKLRSTTARVKATTQFVDSLLSRLTKVDGREAVSFLEKRLKDKKFSKFVVEKIKPELKGRTSGFVSVLKLENRKGDNSSMSIARLLLVGKDKDKKAKSKTGKLVKLKKTSKKKENKKK
ncbi:MAG: 50S ribosomal protein L17 [candidate division WS6 bacterium GW2011_GWA2_37_6]|uniref:50S ribosomal protein L17 n=1 Tax=candidate division WS6 bacterium GW2011_GWA2_37_6 TaxID=1619087 RepID=A0A0G0H294_9BACT|nr:MAG: 50S ribosomal protein L17 [candidate division WS6 bacterium GW2011_GWA2_37_6]